MNEKKDWRTGTYYKAAQGKCFICGSEEEIGVDPRFNTRVCKEHATMNPAELLKIKSNMVEQNDNVNKFREWCHEKLKTDIDKNIFETIGYKIEYLSLKSQKTAMMVSKISWGLTSVTAINETLDKIIKNFVD